MKKILIIVQQNIFKPGGTEKFNFNIANSLSKLGIDVTIIMPIDGKINNIKTNFNYIELNNFYIGNQPILKLLILKKTILDINPDIILSNGPSLQDFFIGLLIKLINIKAKYISIYHGDLDTNNFSARIYMYLFFKIFIKLTDKVLFTTKFYKNYIFKKYNIKYPYLISSVGHNFESDLFIKKVSFNGNILFNGRFDKSGYKRKNPELLLNACSILGKKIKNINFITKGDFEIKELIYKSKIINIKSKINIYNNISSIDENYKKIAYNSDLFILPSSHAEGFGIVVLEALNFGIPVIVSDACGSSDFIKQYGIGEVFSAFNKNDLANKIELIIKNYSTYVNNIEKHYNIIEKAFNWDNISKKLLKNI